MGSSRFRKRIASRLAPRSSRYSRTSASCSNLSGSLTFGLYAFAADFSIKTMNRRGFLRTAGATVGIAPLLRASVESDSVDLAKSVIIIADDASVRERKAATVLAEETWK